MGSRRFIPRRALAVVAGLTLVAAVVPAAFADVGVRGGSYTGTTAPTGMKPQSKLWHHSGSWWGVLFNPASANYEIYKYNKSAWSWSSTGVAVDDRPGAKLDALWDGSELLVGASVQGSVPDKRTYLHRFTYNGSSFVRAGSKVEIQNSQIEEVVLAKDSTGVLWANWTSLADGTVWVTHSTGTPHTDWIAPYPLASGLVPGEQGDSASIVAFGTNIGGMKVGVMWSNSTTTADAGYHFAVHTDGTGDALSDWTFEWALQGAHKSDDHMNLHSLPSGEVLAAVKHEGFVDGDPLISVLRRRADGTGWEQHPVWLYESRGTRAIMLIDTSASRAHVFMAHFNRGIIYHKDAPLNTLAFSPADFGSEFISLSTDLDFNDPTSTKQNVTSSTGLLVLAGADATHRYGFNFLPLGGPAIVPSPPTGVTAVPAAASAIVSWSAPGNDGGAPVSGYEVTPHVNGVAKTPTVFNSVATTQTMTGLVNGTSYTFTVRARNSVGWGPPSAPSPSLIPVAAPSAPRSVTASPGNTSASVTWLPPTSDGGSAITGYTVTSSPGAFTTTVSGSASSAVVAGLTNGTSYAFTVTATNIAGTSPPSAFSNAVVPRTLPGAPTSVTASPGNASASVNWVPPASDGGSPVTGYTVTSSPGGRTAAVSGGATSAVVTGLTNGTSYTFTVTATNAAGTGSPSAPSNAVVPQTVPGAPRSVSATAGNASATVTWLPPTSDGGSPITGYTVTASPGGAAVTVPGGTTTAVVTGLDGVSYTFTVTATNGAGSGPLSTPSNAVVPFTVPDRPTAVAAIPADGAVTVTWHTPDVDGGAPVTGYVVSWAVNGVQQSARTFASIATAQMITGLSNGTAYTFRVAAINAVGTGPGSAPSAPATPRTAPGAPSGVAAVGGDASAIVSWQPPAYDGGSPVRSYVVTPYLDGVGQTPLTFDSPATTQTVNGLANDVSYTFTVRAVNVAGAGAASPQSAPVATHPVGYWMLGADGLVYAFGAARDLGEPGLTAGGIAAVDIEPEPGGDGYWVVDARGRVYAYDAPHLGNVDPARLGRNEQVTSLSATPTGDGYWIFTTRGRVLRFGTAGNHGDLLGVTLNGPILDSIATPSGQGYYMVASDGGVFSFGDATFYGSMGGVRLNAPVQSLVPDPDGTGYWLVASDGGVFTFQAAFRGSMGGVPLNRPVTGMVPYGNGYLMVAEDGGIFSFSDQPFRGSLGANPPRHPIVSVAALG